MINYVYNVYSHHFLTHEPHAQSIFLSDATKAKIIILNFELLSKRQRL